MSPCQGEGRGFESHRPLFIFNMASWPSGKARVCKTLITGSNPVDASGEQVRACSFFILGSRGQESAGEKHRGKGCVQPTPQQNPNPGQAKCACQITVDASGEQVRACSFFILGGRGQESAGEKHRGKGCIQPTPLQNPNPGQAKCACQITVDASGEQVRACSFFILGGRGQESAGEKHRGKGCVQPTPLQNPDPGQAKCACQITVDASGEQVRACSFFILGGRGQESAGEGHRGKGCVQPTPQQNL